MHFPDLRRRPSPRHRSLTGDGSAFQGGWSWFGELELVAQSQRVGATRFAGVSVGLWMLEWPGFETLMGVVRGAVSSRQSHRWNWNRRSNMLSFLQLVLLLRDRQSLRRGVLHRAERPGFWSLGAGAAVGAGIPFQSHSQWR